MKPERPCIYESRTKEVYEAIMPALRHVAHRCGYALAIHGSLKTDIDIIACPWRDSAIGAESLAEKLRLVIEIIIGIARVRDGDEKPAYKPCGRLAWSFYTTPKEQEHLGPYIDLSVMPICITPEES